MGRKLLRNSLFAAVLSSGAGLTAFAQEQGPPPPPDPQQSQEQGPVQPPPSQSDGAWHRFSDSRRPDPNASQPYSSNQANQPYQSQPNQSTRPYQPAPPAYASVPPSLTIPAGTWITVRTTNPISTEHNQPGDAVSAVLVQPLVVNGIVVARRGQMVEGRVTASEKAGRVSGVSKLGLELTQLVLVDGQQVTLHTQMMDRKGNTSYGRDAAAIGTTTAVGAAIGASVNGGVGAGVGAAGGLVASTLGVLLTRGKPAVIYPETVLTFQVREPITVSTVNSADAFRPVSQQDYEANDRRLVSSAPPRPAPYYGGSPYYAAPYPFYYGFGPYYGSGYYGGGAFVFRGGRYRRW